MNVNYAYQKDEIWTWAGTNWEGVTVWSWAVSISLSALALFSLGAAKFFVTRLSPLRSELEMLMVGGVAALVAYGIGWLLKNIGG